MASGRRAGAGLAFPVMLTGLQKGLLGGEAAALWGPPPHLAPMLLLMLMLILILRQRRRQYAAAGSAVLSCQAWERLPVCSCSPGGLALLVGKAAAPQQVPGHLAL